VSSPATKSAIQSQHDEVTAEIRRKFEKRQELARPHSDQQSDLHQVSILSRVYMNSFGLCRVADATNDKK
jgi:hypothetical protein